MLLLFLVAMQATLGAFVIWSGKDPVINTAHVVNGALVLGTSLVLTLRSFQAAMLGSRVRGIASAPVPGFGGAEAARS